MEELIALRKHIEARNYEEALGIVNELEEMSRDDKLNKIDSFATVLLIHLIKQAAENRTTRSWDNAINFAVRDIKKVNNRRRAGGKYADKDTLQSILHDAFPYALAIAAEEAFAGVYSDQEIEHRIEREAIIQTALTQIDG